MINFGWFSPKTILEVGVKPYQVVKLPEITSEEAKDMCISLWMECIKENYIDKGKIPDIPVIDAKELIKERRL